MKRNLALFFALPLLMVSAFVCEEGMVDPGPIHPGWVDSLMATYRNEPVGNPPREIWQYRYNGAVVYFVPAQCCDQYSDLYDQVGTLLAHPDGGITGLGDGRCADFVRTATDPVLIWRDPRTRN